ncbi:MAG: CD3324 family protein [bacterium]|nr:CD3324 family protein [bacterium]
MSYINALYVLPEDLLDRLQDYIDGGYIYIPRKAGNKKAWGEGTKSKAEISTRNAEIYRKYTEGISVAALAEIYYLSPKSLQRIIAKMKLEYR